jgi:hypothetical protein
MGTVFQLACPPTWLDDAHTDRIQLTSACTMLHYSLTPVLTGCSLELGVYRHHFPSSLQCPRDSYGYPWYAGMLGPPILPHTSGAAHVESWKM